MRSEALAIEMPDYFPTEPYDRLGEITRPHSPSQAWGESAVGWNALGYRFRAAAEASDAFIESLARDRAEHEERFVQETALYGFFVGGQSAIESFGYSV